MILGSHAKSDWAGSIQVDFAFLISSSIAFFSRCDREIQYFGQVNEVCGRPFIWKSLRLY